MNGPKVSVSLITYNHAPYIAQAIEGVLAQRTNFEVELLIGEDESTDGTRDIVRDYAAKHPDRIRLFLHERKDVLHIRGKPTGRRNFGNNLREARGEYVALLEGDDFWTCPDKLQRQVDLLDGDREAAICFHDADVLDEDGNTKHRDFGGARDRYELEDLLSQAVLMPTCSVLYRNGLFGELPAWWWQLGFGDLSLHVLNAARGHIRYIDEVMAVYRIHRGGVWSGRRQREKTEIALEFYEVVNEFLDFRYDALIRNKISMLHYDLVWSYQCEGDRAKMREHLRQAWRAAIFNPQTPRAYALKATLLAFVPGLHRFARRTTKPATSSSDA